MTDLLQTIAILCVAVACIANTHSINRLGARPPRRHRVTPDAYVDGAHMVVHHGRLKGNDSRAHVDEFLRAKRRIDGREKPHS